MVVYDEAQAILASLQEEEDAAQLSAAEVSAVQQGLANLSVDTGHTKTCTCGFPMEAGLSPDILSYPMVWEWKCPLCHRKEIAEDPHEPEPQMDGSEELFLQPEEAEKQSRGESSGE